MYGVWWKTLWCSIYIVIIVANIAFAFNLVNIVNPTSMDLDYTQYYFGVSSFIDAFKVWFAENNFLQGFNDVLRKFGNFISKIYSTYKTIWSTTGRLMNWNPSVAEIIGGIIALVFFTVQLVPMVLMVLMGLLYITYLLFFAIQIVLFIVAFFGGSFATPLPDVYPELQQSISSLRAIMV